MYDHMEQLAQLNVTLTQQRNVSGLAYQQPLVKKLKEEVVSVVDDPHGDGEPERVQRLQATIVQQAHEMERLKRLLKSSVPMLPLDGSANALVAGSEKEEEEGSLDEEGDNQDRDRREAPFPRRRRGLEKLPLTSLHAQLRAKDAAIHRLEQHATELTQTLNASHEKKHRAVAQYQQLTKSQQTQLRKCAARIDEQQRTLREREREIEGLKAYVAVLEKKVLAEAARPPQQ
jgi:hypothetical protein